MSTPEEVSNICNRQFQPSQFLCPRQFSQCLVKGAQRQMAGCPGNLEYQAIRKSQRRLGAEMRQCGTHHIGVLQHQGLVDQQQFERRNQLLRRAAVNRIENPGGFGKYEM